MIRVSRGMHCFVSAADYSRVHQGFAPAGPQDRFSCEFANRMLGNQAHAGAIEFTLAPAVVQIEETCHVVIGGAPCEISIDGKSQPDWTVVRANAGSELRIVLGQTGCRVYLCVAGGIDSEGTFVGDSTAGDVGRSKRASVPSWEPPLGIVRVLAGPESTLPVLETLASGSWEVGTQSNSIGLRMSGPALALPSFDIQSAPTQDGTIQATRAGLIALLRNRGTLGGYPRVATVIDCDVDRLAQFRPGQQVRFQSVDDAEARQWYDLQQHALQQVGTD